jgi:hypothetical protein
MTATRAFMVVVVAVGSSSCEGSAAPTSEAPHVQRSPPFFVSITAQNGSLKGTAVLHVSSGDVKFNLDVQREIGPQLATWRIIGSVSGRNWTRQPDGSLVLAANFSEGFPDSSRGMFRVISASLQPNPAGTSPGSQSIPGSLPNSSKELYAEESLLASVRTATGSIVNGVGDFHFELIPYRTEGDKVVYDLSKPLVLTAQGRVTFSCRVVDDMVSTVVATNGHPECVSLFGP